MDDGSLIWNAGKRAREAFMTTNGNAIQNPLIGTANKAASDMVRYAAEFGMTPSARARISAQPPGGAGSKFHGLIGGQES
jgi:phage terminase small subunit